MTNIVLILAIFAFLIYACYDQFLMGRRKGKTQLKIMLKKQGKVDALIFIGLIIIIGYQAFSQANGIVKETLFLLVSLILLAFYTAFIRTPMLLLKPQGFFYANIYIEYAKIAQLNLTTNQILVITLKNGKRLFVQFADRNDVEKVVGFFGGYK